MDDRLKEILSDSFLCQLFPPEKADQFFEALFGDPEEGAYDICLVYRFFDEKRGLIKLDFELRQRPGRCLACHLTYGLPEVFARHPVINVSGLVEEISRRLPGLRVADWRLGPTEELTPSLHAVPLWLEVVKA
ncbi:pancreas/duodenum homeobox protein 1 [Thermosulfuriphilus sp.]